MKYKIRNNWYEFIFIFIFLLFCCD
jgi:hypothetical protein